MTKFRQHKTNLLSNLRSQHERRTHAKPFNADRSWRELEDIALLHLKLQFDRQRSGALKPAKPLNAVASSLRHVRTQLDTAIRQGGYGALLSAWRVEKGMTLDSALSFKRGSTRIIADLTTAFRTLVELEAAANRAANSLRRKGGRPKGPSKLPGPDVIIGLARVYQRGTGLTPAAGKGPFANFVFRCLIALGHSGISQLSVVDSIKIARHQANLYAVNSGRPSPFARG